MSEIKTNNLERYSYQKSPSL